MINFIPAMLRKAKFEELSVLSAELLKFYKEDENGFFRLVNIVGEERAMLKKIFKELGFSALNFTDSRAVFQFYNLDYLWTHVKFAVKNDIKLLHLAVEPLSASEIYRSVTGEDFINQITDNPPDYNYFKTIYADKYFFNKPQILREIKEFTSTYLN